MSSLSADNFYPACPDCTRNETGLFTTRTNGAQLGGFECEKCGTVFDGPRTDSTDPTDPTPEYVVQFSYHTRTQVYHFPDPDHARDDPRPLCNTQSSGDKPPTAVEPNQAAHRRLCDKCKSLRRDDKEASNRGDEHDLRPCPRCGIDVKSIPHHLRHRCREVGGTEASDGV